MNVYVIGQFNWVVRRFGDPIKGWWLVQDTQRVLGCRVSG